MFLSPVLSDLPLGFDIDHSLLLEALPSWVSVMFLLLPRPMTVLPPPGHLLNVGVLWHLALCPPDGVFLGGLPSHICDYGVESLCKVTSFQGPRIPTAC